MRLGSLREVYEHTGPFVTLYLDTPEPDPEGVGTRWSAIRHRLTEQGADERTVDALAKRVEHQRPGGRVLVAGGGEVLLDDDLPSPPSDLADDAYVGPVPQLMPYLRLRGPQVPHVMAVVDDEGANITAVPSIRPPETVNVSGEQAVADEIARLAREVHARAVVLAGSESRRRRVQGRLPDEVRDQVVQADVAGADRATAADILRTQVDRTVESAVQARTAETQREFEQERGRPERAVEGWEPALQALREGRVRALLWDADHGGRTERLHVGSHAREVATDEGTLRERGQESVASVPADAAVVRALAETEGEFFPVEAGSLELTDGVGALLR